MADIISKEDLRNIFAPLDTYLEKPERTEHVIKYNKYNSEGAFHRIRVLRDAMKSMSVELNKNSRGMNPVVREKYDDLFDDIKKLINEEVEMIKYGD